MNYICLKNRKGVILPRRFDVFDTEICFRFQNAPAGAVAVFDNGERTYYRDLNDDGTCGIPPVEGVLNVSVAVLDGTLAGERWACEKVRCEKLSSGEIFVAPDDTELPGKVAEMCLENDALRARLENAETAISRLQEQLERLMEGYDIT